MTPVDINLEKSSLYSKYFHLLRIFKLLQNLTKKYILKKWGIVEIIKVPMGFELMIHTLVDNTLTHCVPLFYNNYGKEHIKKMGEQGSANAHLV